MAEQEGRWVTVNGAHVFIKDGESENPFAKLNKTVKEENKRGSGNKYYEGVLATDNYREITEGSENTINDERDYSFILKKENGKRLMPFSRKKSDLVSVLQRYDVKDFQLNTYNNRTGKATLKKLQDAGYVPVKVYIGDDDVKENSAMHYLFRKP